MQTQVNIQTQRQQQTQQQHLSPQQLQVVRMLEMPIAQLEQHVQLELDSNPSLDASYDEPGDETLNYENATNDRDNDYENDDDYLPCVHQEQRRMENGNLTSFIDSLNEQVALEELTGEQRQIMEYLIGSLDDNGFLQKDLMVICDELDIYNNLYVEEWQVEEVLMRLQEFDPPGIGARSLQECLLIQVERMKGTPLTMLMYRVINECYDELTSNHWDRIRRRLGISELQADELRSEIRRRLNPKPGSAFNEVEGRSLQQITPDIIVNVDFDNNISFELNNGRLPRLHVVKEDEEMLKTLTEDNSEASSFLRHNISSATQFIEALRQRNDTIVRTMKAIIRLQRKYILSGDDSDLRPMALKDVAERTGLDLSTISRVSRAKYVQTPWGTFLMRHFFSDAYTTKDGETMSTKEIKQALREVIEQEDKRRPLSDDKLVTVMTEKGYPIARRTIAKYREQLGIPVARMRKQ